ncbi:SDR family oxidoreductase [Hyphobacterium sp.]|uniref:SDR family oxidoreductase n=1 Tax=Hyphobacterium sp. TaxID=2004662 RepID=UPI0037491B6E
MRILVLGGYGLIGSAIVRRLIADGHEVTGLGRSRSAGERLIPSASWRTVDIARLTTPGDWQPFIAGFDAVINASGALQSGGRDNVSAVQSTAIKSLIDACEAADIQRFVQISAPMAAADASTDFMRSKGEADAHLKASSLDWTVYRPGLVIGHAAYGGTALLRMLAAQPAVGLMAFGDQRIQAIAVDDIAEAVARAIDREELIGVDADLVEDSDHALVDIVAAIRRWLGWAPHAAIIALPRWITSVMVVLANLAGALGWRSPLRSNAVKVLEDGISGDASQTRRVLGRPALSLTETLNSMPATLADRWHARLSLLFPIALSGLILFWLVSGLIGALHFAEASRVLSSSPAAAISGWLVAAGIIADLGIAAGLAWRKTTAWAVKAAIALTLSYLALGSWLTPELWADPLGPFVKSATLILLHLMVLPLLEER